MTPEAAPRRLHAPYATICPNCGAYIEMWMKPPELRREAEAAAGTALDVERLARALKATRLPIVNSDGRVIGFASPIAEDVADEYARLAGEDSK